MIEAESVPASRVSLTSQIVSAYLSHNSVRANDLPDLINTVHTALGAAGQPLAAEKTGPLVPPISIKRSITDEHLISMEDGGRYKSLRRHLTKLGLTPEAYREKWGLPLDYPMVASGYSRQRSELAKSIGFGKRAKSMSHAEPPVEPSKKRGRPKKAA